MWEELTEILIEKNDPQYEEIPEEEWKKIKEEEDV